LKPALGYPLTRDTHPGEQGGVMCDGVGSHLCYNVIEKAIEMGMEILLRVPYLSYIVQGEDIVNFKVTSLLLLLMMLLMLLLFLLVLLLLFCWCFSCFGCRCCYCC
jgi:hypothetical protein